MLFSLNLPGYSELIPETDGSIYTNAGICDLDKNTRLSVSEHRPDDLSELCYTSGDYMKVRSHFLLPPQFTILLMI